MAESSGQSYPCDNQQQQLQADTGSCAISATSAPEKGGSLSTTMLNEHLPSGAEARPPSAAAAAAAAASSCSPALEFSTPETEPIGCLTQFNANSILAVGRAFLEQRESDAKEPLALLKVKVCSCASPCECWEIVEGVLIDKVKNLSDLEALVGAVSTLERRSAKTGVKTNAHTKSNISRDGDTCDLPTFLPPLSLPEKLPPQNLDNKSGSKNSTTLPSCFSSNSSKSPRSSSKPPKRSDKPKSRRRKTSVQHNIINRPSDVSTLSYPLQGELITGNECSAQGQHGNGQTFFSPAGLAEWCTQSQYEYLPPSFYSSAMPCHLPPLPMFTGNGMSFFPGSFNDNILSTQSREDYHSPNYSSFHGANMHSSRSASQHASFILPQSQYFAAQQNAFPTAHPAYNFSPQHHLPTGQVYPGAEFSCTAETRRTVSTPQQQTSPAAQTHSQTAAQYGAGANTQLSFSNPAPRMYDHLPMSRYFPNTSNTGYADVRGRRVLNTQNGQHCSGMDMAGTQANNLFSSPYLQNSTCSAPLTKTSFPPKDTSTANRKRGNHQKGDSSGKSRPSSRKHTASAPPGLASDMTTPKTSTSACTLNLDPQDPGMLVASPVRYTDNLNPESTLSKKFVMCCSCHDRSLSDQTAAGAAAAAENYTMTSHTDNSLVTNCSTEATLGSSHGSQTSIEALAGSSSAPDLFSNCGPSSSSEAQLQAKKKSSRLDKNNKRSKGKSKVSPSSQSSCNTDKNGGNPSSAIGVPAGAHYLGGVNRTSVDSHTTTSYSTPSVSSSDSNFTTNNNNLAEYRQTDVEFSELPDQERRGSHTCLGCQLPVHDRYVLRVRDHGYWHADCLRCSTCQVNLSAQASCYVRDERVFCRADYNILFGLACVKCSLHFKKDEDWMRVAGQHRYHIACFLCKICKRQLGSNERYHLVNGTDIYCTNHYRDLVNGDNADGQHPPKKAKRNRTSYTEAQIKYLQERFNIDSNPDGNELEKIAARIGLKKRVVQVWFQNNRARLKKTANNTKGGNQENKNPSTSNGLTGACNLQDEMSFEWDHSMESSLEGQAYPTTTSSPLQMLTAPSSSHFLNSYNMTNTASAGPMGAQAAAPNSAHRVMQGQPTNGDGAGSNNGCTPRHDQVSPHHPNDLRPNSYQGGSPDYISGNNAMGGLHQQQRQELHPEHQTSPHDYLNRRSEARDRSGAPSAGIMYPDQVYPDSNGSTVNLHYHQHHQSPFFSAYHSHNGHIGHSNGDVYPHSSYMHSYPAYSQHNHQFTQFPGRDFSTHSTNSAIFSGEGARTNGQADSDGDNHRPNNLNGISEDSGRTVFNNLSVQVDQAGELDNPGSSVLAHFPTAQLYNPMATGFNFVSARGYMGDNNESP
ncbi:LIM/homeobox protein awh [Plakobranchus ocellatus]|uniref:LIM/homeobox protein awh n=1 Tax=Plakobranchus ocellatus TaxID=259542 RepID=A0AAV4CM68_9GAST|nr:LIM/homeobox protein awh [Plakobranchus ocellatus]